MFYHFTLFLTLIVDNQEKMAQSVRYNDFPEDFIRERKLLRAEHIKRIYAYKGQVWRLVLKNPDFNENFRGTKLEGIEEKDVSFGEAATAMLMEERLSNVEISKLKDSGKYGEKVREFFHRIVGEQVYNNEAYASNIRFLTGKVENITKLIHKGSIGENLDLLIITKVPGTTVLSSPLPLSMLLKAMMKAYDIAYELLTKYGYLAIDIHGENVMVTETGDIYLIDFELGERNNNMESAINQWEDVFNIRYRLEDMCPYFSLPENPDYEEWKGYRREMNDFIEKVRILEIIPDTFFGLRIRDPLMRMMTSYLFQLYQEYEEDNSEEAKLFVVRIIFTRDWGCIRFFKPLRSQVLCDLVNAKFKELPMMSKPLLTLNAFGNPTLMDESPKHKLLLGGNKIGLTAKSIHIEGFPNSFIYDDNLLLTTEPL